MAQAREILKRRKSLQSIGKITRTMEMVATARYQMVRNAATQLRAYTDGMTRMVHHVVTAAPGQLAQPLLTEHPESPRDVMLILTSNRGMCGAYNNEVFELAMKRHDELVAAGRKVEIHAYGNKGAAMLDYRELKTHRRERQFENAVDTEVVAAIAADLIGRFAAEPLGTVLVAHTHYVSAGVQHPTIVQLLPLGELGRLKAELAALAVKPDETRAYDFLPDPDTILGELLPRTVSLRLYQAFLDAAISEQVARMAAMRMATESARDMIDDLTMQYNRVRQGRITTELTEITGGTEAMK